MTLRGPHLFRGNRSLNPRKYSIETGVEKAGAGRIMNTKRIEAKRYRRVSLDLW